jgi:hypothetical protein
MCNDKIAHGPCVTAPAKHTLVFHWWTRTLNMQKHAARCWLGQRTRGTVRQGLLRLHVHLFLWNL